MDYNKPYDQSNPAAGYVNGNPATNTAGSIPCAEGLEYPQREIVAAIKAAGLTPGNGDLTQLLQAIARGGIWLGAFGGTADALTAAIQGAVLVPSLQGGMRVRGIAQAPNATTTPRLTLAGTGVAGAAPVPYPIVAADGASAIAKGAWAAGQFLTFDIDAAGNARFGGAGSVSGAGSGSGVSRAAVVAFETAGTFPWVATSTVADIIYVGGGGSGGSANVLPGGAPGGGGAVRYARFTNLVIGQTYTFTVGAGGVSIAANTVQSGANGGASSGLGVSAGGGNGGGAGSGSGTAATGGAGGTGTGGDRGFSGTSGQAAANSSSAGQTSYPRGGEAPGFGGGGTNNGADGSGNPFPGLDGTAPGAGGGAGYPGSRSGRGHDGAIYIFPA